MSAILLFHLWLLPVIAVFFSVKTPQFCCFLQKPILGHRRVNSDGTVSAVDVDTTAELEECREWQEVHLKSPVRVGVAAREIERPILQGYLDKQMGDEDDWVKWVDSMYL